MTDINFNKQCVLITGGTKGIGAGITKAFLALNATVIILARNKPKRQIQSKGNKAVFFQCDIRSIESINAAINSIKVEYKKIDVLINNAAFGHWDYSWDTTTEIMRAMIAVNVSAVAVLSLAFSQIKHVHPSRLMNIASGAGYALFDSSIPYSASKFFVTALTEGIAQELSAQKLPMRAQLLAPGPIATEFMINAMEGSKMDAMSAEDMDKVQFHTPDQVAEFAMQLYDSDAVVGGVQPDMSFLLSGGLHQVGQLFDAEW
jgi:NAD(P)-dependent dehydrogenase (short-subunit alcohol dehydrogenase family)